MGSEFIEDSRFIAITRAASELLRFGFTSHRAWGLYQRGRGANLNFKAAQCVYNKQKVRTMTIYLRIYDGRGVAQYSGAKVGGPTEGVADHSGAMVGGPNNQPIGSSSYAAVLGTLA